jgi:alkanesulfonate monooxygenase SsuD/methylene tetrahydromethanopterin reductase-like flavin-dependent oxidoreductase (luciferase family)
VGLGYREVEFDAFKVPKGQRLRRFEECLEIVKRLWTEDKVSVETDVCTLANVTLTCRPVQKPHPPIWFAANNDAAVRRAARLGDAWFVGPSANLAEIAPCARLYKEACSATGGGEIALFRYVFVASSTPQAISAAGDPFIQAFESMYFRWPHPVVKRPAGKLTIERLAENRIILGDPKTCVQEIERFRQELGLTHLVCRFSVPGIPREACATSLDLFTREVIPALREDQT